MERLIQLVERAMTPIFGIVGTLMILISTYGVFARDLFAISAPWTDEALRFLDIGMIFIVSASVFLSDSHISLTIFEEKLRAKGKSLSYCALKVFQYAVAFLVNAELCRELVSIIGKQMATNEVTTVLQYPLWCLNLLIFIGCAVTCLFAAVCIVYEVKLVQTSAKAA